MVSSVLLALLFASCYAQTASNPLSESESLELNQDILDYHNWQRSFSALGLVPGPGGSNGVHPGGSDMIKLRWDDGLAGVAYEHSQTCKYHHNPIRGDMLYDARDQMVQFVTDIVTSNPGENIGYGTGYPTKSLKNIVMDGLQSMFEESNDYKWSDNTCSYEHCGHYTQMAWGTTRYIGCGYSLCDTIDIECNDDGSVCDDQLTNAIYYVCNYFPLGNRYTPAGIVDIYNQEGEPCDNCPWDHSKCTYDSAAATSYDSDWTNMPTTETTNGLCIGCGNKYYEICNTGLNNGLGDFCVSTKKTHGCYYDFEANSAGVAQDIQICDPNNDGDNGLEDPDICTLGDQCRYECATCYCQDEGVDRFKACETECDDGLGRNVTGGCLGDDYFAQYIEDVGGCTGGGGGGSGDSGANQAQLS
eukprot:205861_1